MDKNLEWRGDTGENRDSEAENEAYEEYVAQFSLVSMPNEKPLTFREWLGVQDDLDYAIKEDDGGGVYVE
jgi:hypothetical protein